jgi:diguanylate cyclase (GGDEF)-like protein/PAS domain S-box-containing protein
MREQSYLALRDVGDILTDLQVFDMAATGMVLTDSSGLFRRVNHTFASMLGRSVEELTGASFSALTFPEDVARNISIWSDLIAGTLKTARLDKRYVRKDGSALWVDMTCRGLVGPAGTVEMVLTQALDISARMAAEEEHRRQAMLFNTLFDAVFIADPDGRITDCNPAAERLSGRTRAELIDAKDVPEKELWPSRMRAAMEQGAWAGDVSFGIGPGRRVTETTIVPLGGVLGGRAGGIAVCRDVTEARGNALALAQAEEQARHDAGHDLLTGLPNRKLLIERFEEFVKSPQAADGVALLMIDLDRFKDVNDTLGHQYGDELLIQVGQVLQASVREQDMVSRLGGDEFAVLLPGVNTTDKATGLADRVRVALEQPFRVKGVDLDVEASVGIALSGDHRDVSTVMRQADVAMYVAKRQGLDVFAYDPTIDGHSTERLGLLGELRGALARNELVMYFQPKIGMATGDIVGAEALVRWRHPTLGMIMPDEFVPMAEHTGLIRSLTRYVLDASLAEARRWIDAGRPLLMSVNLSARNLLEERLVEQVIELLGKHRVPPTLLELEITETSIVTDPTNARRLLGRLRALGIRVSIDDFGAGFTSLAVLKNLPINELKIDRSLVADMIRQPSDALIVRSVVQLSHNLGLTAVAEGVEDLDILAAVKAMGVDSVQGYYFSKPLSATDFEAWHLRHNDRDQPPVEQESEDHE